MALPRKSPCMAASTLAVATGRGVPCSAACCSPAASVPKVSSTVCAAASPCSLACWYRVTASSGPIHVCLRCSGKISSSISAMALGPWRVVAMLSIFSAAFESACVNICRCNMALACPSSCEKKAAISGEMLGASLVGRPCWAIPRPPNSAP